MKISFISTKFEKMFGDESKLKKEYGMLRADKIKKRLTEFRAAEDLSVFLPPKSLRRVVTN